MGKVLYVESQHYVINMNHVTHHTETPPGLTPPRLLAGGWERKVLYVDSQHYVLYEPREVMELAWWSFNMMNHVFHRYRVQYL